MTEINLYDAQFRVSMALDTIMGLKTINDLVGEYDLYPIRSSPWKPSHGRKTIDL